MNRDLFVRSNANPIITPAGLPFSVNGVFNPGVALVDGETVLLLRIENRRGISALYAARSANGVDGWRIERQALLEPRLIEYPYEKWGCEDPRVTQIDSHTWMIAYTAYSPFGPGVALATTEDFVSVKRLGLVMSPNNKDATLFPEKIDGSWLMLHRPVTGSGEHVWHASSDDLLHWALPGVLLPANGGPWWDGLKVGSGAPPIRTEKGWLLIYHGVKEAGGGHLIYRLGLALLDLDDPRKQLARSSDWVFAPETEYEQRGLVPDVVYTCGADDHFEIPAALKNSSDWELYQELMAQANVILSSSSYFKRLAANAAQDILYQFEPGHAFEKLGQWRLDAGFERRSPDVGIVTRRLDFELPEGLRQSGRRIIIFTTDSAAKCDKARSLTSANTVIVGGGEAGVDGARMITALANDLGYSVIMMVSGPHILDLLLKAKRLDVIYVTEAQVEIPAESPSTVQTILVDEKKVSDLKDFHLAHQFVQENVITEDASRISQSFLRYDRDGLRG